MARLVQAVAKYGPRIIRTRTATVEDVADLLSRRQSASLGTIRLVLTDLQEALVFLNSGGEAVKLPGLGTFGLSIDRNGRLNPSYFADPRLREQLAAAGTRNMTVRNRKNIGLSDAGYKALWDAEHPDDPVVLSGS
jgi:hypothetical protein